MSKISEEKIPEHWQTNSIRGWVEKDYNLSKEPHLVRKAARIVKRLGIGEPVGGRTGTLLTPDEWSQVKIGLYGVR